MIPPFPGSAVELTRAIDELYAACTRDPSSRPLRPTTEPELFAGLVYAARVEQNHPEVDFARDADGLITGVKGIRIRAWHHHQRRRTPCLSKQPS